MRADPPFESPIEEHWAAALVPHLAEGVKLIEQHEVATRAGRFRLDFLAVHPTGLRIGFECDGKDFHEQARDEWRDAMILGDDQADTILRIRAQDIWYHRDDMLFLIAKLYPSLFAARAHGVFERMATEQVLRLEKDDLDRHQIHFYYSDFGPGQEAPFDVILFHRTRLPTPGRRQFWKRLHQFAVDDGGSRLEDIIGRFGTNAG